VVSTAAAGQNSSKWWRASAAIAATQATRTDALWLTGTRWVAAGIFLGFGVTKFVNHAAELASFRHYPLPAPSLLVYLIGALETGGGLLLAAGLLTRLTALALAADMIGAIVLSGLARGEIISLTLAPLLLVSMIILIRFGAGAWSLDSRLLRLTGAAEPAAEQMSGRRIVVRAATARDESALARIYRRASLANPGDRPALLAHPEVLRLPKDIVTSGRTRVASISGTIIGFARTRATADEVCGPPIT
jgi:uncharacterized membrane protein YphA (DoxX/SURF4 family)